MHKLYMLSFSDCVQLHLPFVLASQDYALCHDERLLLKHSSTQIIDYVNPGGWDKVETFPRIAISALVLPFLVSNLNLSCLYVFSCFVSGLGGGVLFSRLTN